MLLLIVKLIEQSKFDNW